MIKKVIHIADLHIPNSCKQRPYDEMLKTLAKQVLGEMKGFKKDEVRIVIAGDVFHNKIKASNEAKSMFHTLLNYFNAMCRTIIIAGNHDMLERNHDRTDSISPTFEIKGVYKNVVYADKVLNYASGYIEDDNVIWAVYSMFDKFQQPNIEGLKTPENRIIGLFHGEVNGSKTETGYESENGLDPSTFKGCDCVMAGHIHKYQTIKKHGVPIVYGSSVFQQNAGENTTNHGYVVWNLEDMSYEMKEVPNSHKIYRFKMFSYDDVKNDTEKLLNL